MKGIDYTSENMESLIGSSILNNVAMIYISDREAVKQYLDEKIEKYTELDSGVIRAVQSKNLYLEYFYRSKRPFVVLTVGLVH